MKKLKRALKREEIFRQNIEFRNRLLDEYNHSCRIAQQELFQALFNLEKEELKQKPEKDGKKD